MPQSSLSWLESSAASSARVVEFARLYRCDCAHWLAAGEGSPGWEAPALGGPSEQETVRLMSSEQKHREALARAEFAERLTQAFRLARRLRPNGEPDRAWLAAQAGVTVQALSHVFTGKTVPSAYTNALIATALSVNSNWLATGEGSPNAGGASTSTARSSHGWRATHALPDISPVELDVLQVSQDLVRVVTNGAHGLHHSVI